MLVLQDVIRVSATKEMRDDVTIRDLIQRSLLFQVSWQEADITRGDCRTNDHQLLVCPVVQDFLERQEHCAEGLTCSSDSMQKHVILREHLEHFALGVCHRVDLLQIKPRQLLLLLLVDRCLSLTVSASDFLCWVGHVALLFG